VEGLPRDIKKEIVKRTKIKKGYALKQGFAAIYAMVLEQLEKNAAWETHDNDRQSQEAETGLI